MKKSVRKNENTAYKIPSGETSEPSVVREYDIASLVDHRDNHFHRIDGSKWEEFVTSVREFGVVSPLIIRPGPDADGRYEILAGHNRRSAAAEAGLKTVPCIELDVDDVDASVLLGITNHQRESVSDLEWGWTYRTTLEALKHQGKANAGETAGKRSIDIVARRYGVSRKTAQRKIRLTYLVPQLYDLGMKMGYSQKMLVHLSYLPPVLQINVVQAVIIEHLKLTERAAKELRDSNARQHLDINDVIRICRSCQETEDRREKLRRPFKCEIPESLFPPYLKENRRQDYITAALAYIRDHRIDLNL